jgi:hypothetical protein
VIDDWLEKEQEDLVMSVNIGANVNQKLDIDEDWFIFTAQWYGAGLGAGWWVVHVPAGAGNFSLHHRVQTISVAQSNGYQGLFPWE